MERMILVNLLLIFSVSTAYTEENEYDFIVVGAGGSGAVVASRLSEDEKYTVLLLEAGGEPPYLTEIPYLAAGPFGGEYDWNFYTEKQETASQGLIDQKWVHPRGKALGGSTVLNSLAYTRCNPRDYDLWEKLGNKGWGYDSVLKYYKKLEDYQIPIRDGDENHFGKGGPVTITHPPYKTRMFDAFLEAGKELGYDVISVNGKKQTGFGNQEYSLKNGTRWSTYAAYLKPAMNRKNLIISARSFVTKILFDGTRAIGVKYEKNEQTLTAKARYEVIISGGAISSPPLLMLSGVGPRETLEKLSIPVVVDSPGVGQNFLDHVSVGGVLFPIKTPLGFNPLFADMTPENLELWERTRQGPLTVPSRGEGMAFMNSKYANPDEDYPDFELQFFQSVSTFLQFDKEVYKKAFGLKDGYANMALIYPIVLRPKSVGYITINSTNPHDHPVIQPRYLSHPDDAKVLKEGIRAAIKVMETKVMKGLGAEWHGRKYPKCEHLEELTEEYLDCYVLHYSLGFFHQSGTCKMGPSSDKMAVVDDSLRVHGAENLRVIDMSITPTIVTGHTMAPAIMIGEKGADLIKERWNMKRS